MKTNEEEVVWQRGCTSNETDVPSNLTRGFQHLLWAMVDGKASTPGKLAHERRVGVEICRRRQSVHDACSRALDSIVDLSGTVCGKSQHLLWIHPSTISRVIVPLLIPLELAAFSAVG